MRICTPALALIIALLLALLALIGLLVYCCILNPPKKAQTATDADDKQALLSKAAVKSDAADQKTVPKEPEPVVVEKPPTPSPSPSEDSSDSEEEAPVVKKPETEEERAAAKLRVLVELYAKSPDRPLSAADADELNQLREKFAAAVDVTERAVAIVLAPAQS